MNKPNEIKSQLPHRALARWRCHRGMLELDLLLIPFFDACYDQLNIDSQISFNRLLACQDPDIYAWLLELDHLTDDKELQYIVHQIIHFSQTQALTST